MPLNPLTWLAFPKVTAVSRPDLTAAQKMVAEELNNTFTKINEIVDQVNTNETDITDAEQDILDILTDLANKQDVSPNDGVYYLLYNGGLASSLRFINAANLVGDLFSIQRVGNGIEVNSNFTSLGKFNGVDNAYWQANNTSGEYRMKFITDNNELPETNDDYTGGITPSDSGNKIITYKTVNPPSIEITSATATLDSSYSNSNGEINYNNAVGGDLIIEDDLLEIDQLMSLYISNTGMPTFVAGTGVTIVNKDGLFTGSQRYGTIIISKKDTGEFNISGDLA